MLQNTAESVTSIPVEATSRTPLLGATQRPSSNGCYNTHFSIVVRAVGAPMFIFLSGGMNVSWGLGFGNILAVALMTTHLRISWFIAAIVGAGLSLLVQRIITFKQLMQFSALLLFTGGLVLAILPSSIPALLAARYLDGLANGLSFAATLALIGELSDQKMRGYLASRTEHMAYMWGILLQIINQCWSDNENSASRVQGLCSCSFGFAAFLMATLCSVESPVVLLSKGQEQLAIDAINRLQLQHSSSSQEELEQHRNYLSHSESLRLTENWQHAYPALICLSLLRALYALSFCMLLSFALTVISTNAYGFNSSPAVIFALMRLIGSCSAVFAVDTAGRKFTLLLGLLLCCGLTFGIGQKFSAERVTVFDTKQALWLLWGYQFLAGICFAPTSAYLSEAFPFAIKRYCICLVYILEQLLQLLICLLDVQLDAIEIYFFTLSGLLAAAFLLGFWFLPETKALTLQEAERNFQHFLQN